jgi:transposase
MATKAGIWIDHRQAIVVLVTDAGKTIKQIASKVQSPDRSKSKHKYSKNDFVAEDRRQHKKMNHLTTFYNEVVAYIRDAEALLIVGPGEAKGEFVKCLKSEKLRGRTVDLETTDRMTVRQLAAKVDLHFAKPTAKKPATPKVAVKKATKKRPKKTGR